MGSQRDAATTGGSRESVNTPHRQKRLVSFVANVVKSIEDSRKMLLIVSNAFASSRWCHFEQTMAQTRLFCDDTNRFMLVLHEDVHDVSMSPGLRLHMARQTYIEWTDNPVGQQLFWVKLTRALTAPLTGERMIDSDVTQLVSADNMINSISCDASILLFKKDLVVLISQIPYGLSTLN